MKKLNKYIKYGRRDVMQLSFPKGHEPRYENFQLDGLLDETLREGSERCLFSIDDFKR
ncbi:hypothetical protein [Ectobacillus polymachus]|uniref:hypothetical protein n=1 Tax=Ectobacillus polymachus TaxID=1508806 RepID=UPI003A892C59